MTIDNLNTVKTVCGMGRGPKCCRYLGADKHGFCCLKKTDKKNYIDLKVKEKEWSARGDNCAGMG